MATPLSPSGQTTPYPTSDAYTAVCDPQETVDTPLPKFLFDILTLFTGAHSGWYPFGLELGFTSDQLDGFNGTKNKHQIDPYMQMIIQWLKKQSPKEDDYIPLVKTLNEALDKSIRSNSNPTTTVSHTIPKHIEKEICKLETQLSKSLAGSKRQRPTGLHSDSEINSEKKPRIDYQKLYEELSETLHQSQLETKKVQQEKDHLSEQVEKITNDFQNQQRQLSDLESQVITLKSSNQELLKTNKSLEDRIKQNKKETPKVQPVAKSVVKPVVKPVIIHVKPESKSWFSRLLGK